MEFFGFCCSCPVIIGLVLLIVRAWCQGGTSRRLAKIGAVAMGALMGLATYTEGHYILLDEAIVSAGCEGDAAQIERLVAWGADPNKPNDDGGYALPCAVGNGHVAAARALLRHGADPSLGGFFGVARDLARQSGDPEMRRLFRPGRK